jgi:hypothetical protein
MQTSDDMGAMVVSKQADLRAVPLAEIFGDALAHALPESPEAATTAVAFSSAI